MNSYINELLGLLSAETKTDGISEFEITVVDDVLKISRCKTEMLLAVLEFIKRHKFRAELINGAITVKIERDF